MFVLIKKNWQDKPFKTITSSHCYCLLLFCARHYRMNCKY